MKTLLITFLTFFISLNGISQSIEFYSDWNLTKKKEAKFSGNEEMHIKIHLNPNIMSICRKYKDQLQTIKKAGLNLGGRKGESFNLRVSIIDEEGDSIYIRNQFFNNDYHASKKIDELVRVNFFTPNRIITGCGSCLENDLWFTNFMSKKKNGPHQFKVICQIQYKVYQFSSVGTQIGSSATPWITYLSDEFTYIKSENTIISRNFNEIHTEDRMNDAELKAEIKYQIAKLDWIDEVIQIKLPNVDWYIQKDKYTDKVLYRTTTAHLWVKMTDGDCASLIISPRQEYAGNGYSKQISLNRFNDKDYRGSKNKINLKFETYCNCP